MKRLLLALVASSTFAAFAAGETEFSLSIEGNKFTPDRIEVPAGKKIKLTVENKDAAAEEFESSQLKIEKVIPAKSKATIYVGPLKPGEYKFVGEFHEKTANGVIVAK